MPDQPTSSEGATRATFVPLQWGQPAVVHDPVDDRDTNHIGLIYMHPKADYMTWPDGLLTHGGETKLTAHGFRVLLTNSRSHTPGGYHMHEILPDIAAAVTYLRDQPEIEHVLLMGQSGGSQLMGFYQNVAENGPEVWQHDDVLYPCPDGFDESRPQAPREHYDLGTLPPADGVVLFDVLIGYGPLRLQQLGPQVIDDADPRARNHKLDMFDPETTVDDAFLDRFFAGQAARMEGLIEMAQHRLSEIEAGHGTYADDEPMIVPDTRTDITEAATHLLARSREEWPVLDVTDGAIEERIVEQAVTSDEDDFGQDLGLTYASSSAPPLELGNEAVLRTTVRKFLSSFSARPTDDYRLTEDSFEGIDWQSSYTSLPANVEGISCPLLVMGMSGSRYIVQQEAVYTHAQSQDREMVFIEGGNHFYQPVSPEYGDTVSATYDYVAEWILDRFA